MLPLYFLWQAQTENHLLIATLSGDKFPISDLEMSLYSSDNLIWGHIGYRIRRIPTKQVRINAISKSLI